MQPDSTTVPSAAAMMAHTPFPANGSILVSNRKDAAMQIVIIILHSSAIFFLRRSRSSRGTLLKSCATVPGGIDALTQRCLAI